MSNNKLMEIEEKKVYYEHMIHELDKSTAEIIGEGNVFCDDEWKFVPYRCDICGALVLSDNKIFNSARREKENDGLVWFSSNGLGIALLAEREVK